MEGGFITLHRKITQWEWYTDANTFKVFVHLLLTANHDDKKWRGITVKRGQTLTSRSHLAKETGLSVQNVRTALEHLKSTNEITTQTTKHYTLITVAKYDDYQSKEKRLARQSTNSQPTANQQVTTNNNDNNDNKKQLYYGEFQNVKLSDAELEKLKTKFPDSFEERIEKLSSYMASKGKSYKSHYATILTWARKENNGNERIKDRVTEDSGQVEDYSDIFINGA
jgi:biotin operon repressor